MFRATFDNLRLTIYYRAIINEQNIRDAEAERCLGDLKAGKRGERRMVLFLRPFSADTRVKLKDSTTDDGYDVLALESRLVAGFQKKAVTVSFQDHTVRGRGVWGDAFADLRVRLDDPRFGDYVDRLFYMRFGAVRVSSDAWFEDFRLVASNADLILSVPLDASGAAGLSATMLELVALKDLALLDRCVFLMPPEQTCWLMQASDEELPGVGRRQVWYPRDRKISDVWEATREKLADAGLALPPFVDSPPGTTTLFTINGDGARAIHVALQDIAHPERYLDQLCMKVTGARE
jgi:hypothetical protein